MANVWILAIAMEMSFDELAGRAPYGKYSSCKLFVAAETVCDRPVLYKGLQPCMSEHLEPISVPTPLALAVNRPTHSRSHETTV